MSAPFIVITSIFEPTEAIQKFGSLPGYNLVVVGDKKSPAQWNADGVTFLSVEKQQSLGFSISEKLPYNHYCRKLIGYLYAIRQKATLIIDTDDDNIPYEDWQFPPFEGDFETSVDGLGFINIYKSYTSRHIWPRGFPLELVTDNRSVLNAARLKSAKNKIGIWQGLADSDPDVDAIYRLVNNEEVFFEDRSPIVLGKETLCPFNSQNTAIRQELFPLLYLPSFVTFRFTDILRGLVAQPILWKHNYHLGFTKATVIQKRNLHNYMRDFESEIPCYLYPHEIIKIVQQSLNSSNDISQDLFHAYSALEKAGIVKPEEIELLQLWLEDLQVLKSL